MLSVIDPKIVDFRHNCQTNVFFWYFQDCHVFYTREGGGIVHMGFRSLSICINRCIRGIPPWGVRVRGVGSGFRQPPVTVVLAGAYS